MASHPANLLLRFLLELAALVAFGAWGAQLVSGGLHFVTALLPPLVAATAWGTFAVQGDPSRSGAAPVPIRGALRLALELVFFGAATAALSHLGYGRLATAFGAITLCHYAVSYERISWLLAR